MQNLMEIQKSQSIIMSKEQQITSKLLTRMNTL